VRLIVAIVREVRQLTVAKLVEAPPQRSAAFRLARHEIVPLARVPTQIEQSSLVASTVFHVLPWPDEHHVFMGEDLSATEYGRGR
jgi:hypothetical protein